MARARAITRRKQTVQKKDAPATPRRGETVPFEMVCKPRSGAGMQQIMNELAPDAVEPFAPDDATIHQVARRLQEMGFRVHVDEASTSVSAEGPHDLFEAKFQTKLRKRARTVRYGQREYSYEFFDTAEEAPEPNVSGVAGALCAAIQRPPIFMQSPLPPPVKYFHLSVPGDVAMLTNASATHRQKTAAGDRATGSGVKVAMLDTGFFMHPYHVMHGYRLNPVAASDATPPADLDPHGHGTGEVANIFACAPDAQVFGIKMGGNSVLSFDKAMALGVKVISCSWGWDLSGSTALPAALIPVRLRILSVVAAGVTVVFSGGNGQISFPGMMPEVIAAGGVFAKNDATLQAANYASSFVSGIFPGRRVPDVCGLVGMQPRATYIMLPIPGNCVIDNDLGGSPQPNKDETATNDGWGVFSGTSAAAPQVAGVCALMLQKKPSLTPAEIKTILKSTATDVTTGVSFQGEAAGPGVDPATGAGLVHALQAWRSA